jgi:hypothetical protein
LARPLAAVRSRHYTISIGLNDGNRGGSVSSQCFNWKNNQLKILRTHQYSSDANEIIRPLRPHAAAARAHAGKADRIVQKKTCPRTG